MYDLFGAGLTGLDPGGAVWLPAWMLAVGAAFALLVCALVYTRGGFESGSGLIARIAVVALVAFTGALWLDHLAARDTAAERRALEARAFELTLRAMTPGSPLACLEGTAGPVIQGACEEALFAVPEATAAAVSYVMAQLSLLAAARNHARASGMSYGKLLTTVRHSVEADRFGIVAHVFAMRGGCQPGQCDLFALLQDASRVRANLVERPFESYVRSQMATPSAAETRTMAGDSGRAEAAPPAMGTKPPNQLYFPSAASIPPVNIMTAEPPARQESPSPSSEVAAQTRKAAQGKQQGRPSANPSNEPDRATPLQLVPRAQ